MIERLRNTDVINIHIHHRCNLACDGCNHFSDLTDKNTPDVDGDQFLKDIHSIAQNINVIEHLAILGGEPLLRKDFEYLFKKALSILEEHNFNMKKLFLYTNGLLLHKNLYIKDLLEKYRFNLQITFHPNKKSKTKNVLINNLKKSADIIRKKTNVSMWRPHTWKKHYAEKDSKIYPFFSKDIEASYNNCTCPNAQVMDGKIYKCAPIAYLSLALQKTGQLKDKFWQPYLNYKPADVSSKHELVEFFKTHKRAEKICSMCPSEAHWIQKRDRKET